MKNLTALLLCLFCAIVAFVVLGFNYFALYQLLPILIFYFFQVKIFSKLKISEPGALICYLLAIAFLLIFPLVAQVMWHFDINKLASKSSTSGLLFVWLPIYAILPGILPCIAAWILLIRNRKKSL